METARERELGKLGSGLDFVIDYYVSSWVAIFLSSKGKQSHLLSPAHNWAKRRDCNIEVNVALRAIWMRGNISATLTIGRPRNVIIPLWAKRQIWLTWSEIFTEEKYRLDNEKCENLFLPLQVAFGKREEDRREGKQQKKSISYPNFPGWSGGMQGGLLGKIKGTLKAKGLFTPWVSGTKPPCKATLC